MSYKVYNYSLVFTDCPIDEMLKAKISELIKMIESTDGKIDAKYEFEVEKQEDGSISSTVSSNGLNTEQKIFLEEVQKMAQDSARNGGKKSRIRNEVEVEREL